jgi:23S rRNA pseudouridine2605 synthase
LKVVIKEGHKRQIREMGKQTGLPVARIIRVRMGTLLLGNLKPKEWRYLTPQEVAALKAPGGVQKTKPVVRKPRIHHDPTRR